MTTPTPAGNPVNVGPFQRIVAVNWPSSGGTTELLYGTIIGFEGGSPFYDFSRDFQIIRLYQRLVGGTDWTYLGPIGFGQVIGDPSPGSVAIVQGSTSYTAGGDSSGRVFDWLGNEVMNLIRLSVVVV